MLQVVRHQNSRSCMLSAGRVVLIWPVTPSGPQHVLDCALRPDHGARRVSKRRHSVARKHTRYSLLVLLNCPRHLDAATLQPSAAIRWHGSPGHAGIRLSLASYGSSCEFGVRFAAELGAIRPACRRGSARSPCAIASTTVVRLRVMVRA